MTGSGPATNFTIREPRKRTVILLARWRENQVVLVCFFQGGHTFLSLSIPFHIGDLIQAVSKELLNGWK